MGVNAGLTTVAWLMWPRLCQPGLTAEVPHDAHSTDGTGPSWSPVDSRTSAGWSFKGILSFELVVLAFRLKRRTQTDILLLIQHKKKKLRWVGMAEVWRTERRSKDTARSFVPRSTVKIKAIEDKIILAISNGYVVLLVMSQNNGSEM